MSEPLDYGELDPGVRELVRLVRGWGFVTTDSGDGVAKLGDYAGADCAVCARVDDCVMDVPHVVAVVSDPAELVREARRLRACLDARGLAGCVEASYSPDAADGVAVLLLTGVSDADLVVAPAR